MRHKTQLIFTIVNWGVPTVLQSIAILRYCTIWKYFNKFQSGNLFKLITRITCTHTIQYCNRNTNTFFYYKAKSTYAAFLILIFNIRNLYSWRYIAPIAVFTFLPTTHSTIIRNASTTNNNNVSIPTTCNSDPTATIFRVYLQILFGLSEISIHTLVSYTISAEPYREALIT